MWAKVKACFSASVLGAARGPPSILGATCSVTERRANNVQSRPELSHVGEDGGSEFRPLNRQHKTHNFMTHRLIVHNLTFQWTKQPQYHIRPVRQPKLRLLMSRRKIDRADVVDWKEEVHLQARKPTYLDG